MNLSRYSLNAIFERFLADFSVSLVAYSLSMSLRSPEKICRKTASNLIIKNNGIGS